MALVRISTQLLDDVERGITDLAEKIKDESVVPLCPEAENNRVMGGPLADWAEDELWAEYPQFRTSLPSDWYGSTDEIWVSMRPYGFTLTVAKPGGFRMPPESSTYHVELRYDHQAVSLPWVTEHLVKRAQYEKALEQHEIKFGQVKNQVRSFLKAGKSLNDAVKRYPDLRLWVPKDYLDRVDKVAAPAPKTIKPVLVQPEVDTNLITSLGVLNKLKSS